MKLAAQTYTVRKFTQTQEDISRTLERLKGIGYRAIQISGFGKYDPEWLKGELDRLDIEVCATHTPPADIIGDTVRVIKEHRLLKIPYVGIGMYKMYTLKECDEFCKQIAPAAEKIAQNGLKLLYHNHAHEFIKEGGEWIIERLLHNFEPELLGLLVDFYWVQRAGYPPEKFLQEHADRIPVVHFKDMRAVADYDVTPQYMEIFEGNMDYETIYRVCVENGVEWAAVEQDFCDGDPFESLQKSFENMKRRGMFLK